jgi:thioredoxin 1
MFTSKFNTLGGALAASLIFAGASFAGEKKAWDEAAFASAQEAGKPILIDVAADWCSTCKKQKPIIESLLGKPEYEDLVAFEVDFDDDKDALRKFGAQNQSTLIVFKGETETGRSVGETDETAIDSLIGSAFEG